MKIAIIGAGGHARVVYEILRHEKNFEIVAFVDNIKHGAEEKILDIHLIGDHSVLPDLLKKGVTGAFIAVGDNKIRAAHFEKVRQMGFEIVRAIHPTTFMATGVKLGNGVFIGARTIISACADIGDNVIVNTGALLEHECVLKNHCHVAPGAILAGRVTVGEGAFIGAGAIVREFLKIGENATVGAGSVVLDDIPANAVAVGTPARVIKMKDDTWPAFGDTSTKLWRELLKGQNFRRY